MIRDTIEASLLLFTVVLVGLLLWSPFMYFEGVVRSQYLKEEKGLDYPWHKAVFLPSEIFINADVRLKKDKE